MGGGGGDGKEGGERHCESPNLTFAKFTSDHAYYEIRAIFGHQTNCLIQLINLYFLYLSVALIAPYVEQGLSFTYQL